MASLEELKAARLKKLDLLTAAGMDPYPAKVPRDFCLEDAHKKFAEYEASGATVNLTGRVMAIRGQGAILFYVLDDGKARFQAVAKKDELDAAKFELLTGAVDMGDFISVTGTMFRTQKGEESILIKNWTMASKALLPLPEKWHGLTDPDEKMRKRYLDFVMTAELRDLFYKKSKFWDVSRAFFKERGFLEVETPTIEVTTGGAEARPFATYHNDYDMDVFMRISIGELWQKRLLAGGFPKVFEIGRAYRNEGTSPEHAQEFTNLEFYWGYADYRDGMKLVTELYRRLATEVFGTTKFSTRGHTFDLADEWAEIDYAGEIKKQTGIDIYTASEKDMMAALAKLKVTYDGTNKERLIDTLWKFCRKNISGPAFLVNHPTMVAPLAKANKDGRTVQKFQPILAGSEIGNGYSELNDPIDQRNRFVEQQKLIERGDEEAMMPDWEFVEMLEHGMPPTCGFGYGERLFTFLADKPLRETHMFPLVRPADTGGAGKSGSAAKKEQKYAAAVINTGAKMERWQELNTIAHLNAAFGARSGKKLFTQDSISTADAHKINLNIKHAIMIKTAGSNDALKKLISDARAAGLEISEFTREMITTTSDKKVIAETAGKKFADVEFLGVMVFGPKEQVDAVTKGFELYK
ncbi:MAG TPA: lysine--tRNA ligase [Candidatus Paceibacterota bacterium]